MAEVVLRVKVELERGVPFQQFVNAICDAIEEGIDPDLFERIEVLDVREE